MKTAKAIWIMFIAAMLLFVGACSGGGGNQDAADDPTVTENNEQTEQKVDEDSNKQQKVELRIMWWGSQIRHDATLKVINLFQQKYPHIKIKPEYMSDGYWDKLNTVVAGGNAPDLIQLGNNYPDYVLRGAIMDISSLYGNELKLDSFDQTVIDSGKMDGKLYAVSLGSNASGIIYNKALIEKAGMQPPKEGWTWEEFEAYSKELKQKLGDGYYPFIDQSAYTHYINHFVRQRGGALYKDGKIAFTAEHIKEWFTMWDRFRKDGLIPDAETTAAYKEGPDNSLFVEGKAVMKNIWSNQVNAYQNAMTDEIGITLLPAGGTTQGMWQQPSQFMSVNAKSKHPKEAVMFIDFMVTDPEATAILGSERGIPGSSKVRDMLKEQGTEVEKRIYEYVDLALKHSRPMDQEMVNIAEWQNELTVQSQKLAFGQSSIEDAAKAVYEAAVKAVAKIQQ
ncbi:ABC transporter substrate-binding protein [Paenibacillus alkalitolerans]|uniref:ABC transporter substrate-binding protein n=1 Tax=Paenibacillus alkalitolerans TaxID=2799335 RepID=UPI0018F5B235|nr:sugar ABC transporter substrate-binding protein [Paenibacillus alkalitolerans]